MRKKEKNKSAIPLLIASLLLITSNQTLAEPGGHYRQGSIQLKGGGKIVGRVRIEGRYERPPPLKVYKNWDFCGAQVTNETFLVGPGGGVQNIVVTILGARGERTESQLKSLVLDNKNCAFVPHVQVAPVGSEILLLNSDPILHDVHARIGSETLFNVGLPTWRQVRKRLTRTGIVRIECDVLHTWMSAYIVVTSSPYFAVTDEKGEFVIDGMLPGSYEIQVWHEQLGNQSKRVMVAGNGTLLVDFVYRLGK